VNGSCSSFTRRNLHRRSH